MRRLLIVLGAALVCVGCARRAVEFPAGATGEAVRGFYQAGGDWGEKFVALRNIEDKAARAEATPPLLAIVEEHQVPRSIQAAHILVYWDAKQAARLPEIRRLQPLAVRGINDAARPELAFYCMQLIHVMGPEAVESARVEIARRFAAPAAEPIQAESGECYVRYGLSYLLVLNGSAGAPGLIAGLDHPDRWVRSCALRGLADLGRMESGTIHGGKIPEDFPKWMPEQIAVARAAARKAIPKITELLWDKDKTSVLPAACSALAVLAEAEDGSPRMVKRLIELLPGQGVEGGVDCDAGGVLAAIYPAGKAELLTLALEGPEGLPHSARVALSRMGPRVVPDVVGLLRDERERSVDYAESILLWMGVKALPGLAAAARDEKNAVIQGRIEMCYRKVYQQGANAALAYAAKIKGEKAEMRGEYIQRIVELAPAAAVAVPALEKLAVEDPDEGVRGKARAAAEKIRAEALPVDPTREAGSGRAAATFFGATIAANKVVLVVEHPGQMIDTFDFPREEVKRSVLSLTPAQRFALVFFAETVDGVFPEKLSAASPTVKRDVAAFVDGMRATKKSDVLESAAEAMKRAFGMEPQVICFVMAGDVDPKFAEVVNKLNVGGKVKVNTIAFVKVSKGAEEALKKVAEENGGVFRYVEEKELGK